MHHEKETATKADIAILEEQIKKIMEVLKMIAEHLARKEE